MQSKICGIKDPKTLKYLINHKNPPNFIGFISNYPKSKRFINLKKLKKLTSVKKRNINYVCVLVKPKLEFLEKIKYLNFDYYQLYKVDPKQTLKIKKKYNKKIITAINIKKKIDIYQYKKYLKISDIILFDGKGYEKSVGFNHAYLRNLYCPIKKMLAGNIKFNSKLDKFIKITDIIDLSGSLETSDKKDITKIDFFLKNIKKLNDKNKKTNSINRSA